MRLYPTFSSRRSSHVHCLAQPCYCRGDLCAEVVVPLQMLAHLLHCLTRLAPALLRFK